MQMTGLEGTWNGYFGKNIFNADQEMYYHASDDDYDRLGVISGQYD